MPSVFADSFYWIALANPRDSWHQEARRVAVSLIGTRLATTEEVLVEFLNWFAGRGADARRQAATLARALLTHSTVTVLPQTHDGFLSALDLYEGRLDKEYSMTDCVSMQTMRARNLTDVLTHDRHFSQEGFHVLFPSDPAS
jgi:uncharacterized protein